MIVDEKLKIAATVAKSRITARFNVPKLRNLIVVLGDQFDIDASLARMNAAQRKEVALRSTAIRRGEVGGAVHG